MAYDQTAAKLVTENARLKDETKRLKAELKKQVNRAKTAEHLALHYKQLWVGRSEAFLTLLAKVRDLASDYDGADDGE